MTPPALALRADRKTLVTTQSQPNYNVLLTLITRMPCCVSGWRYCRQYRPSTVIPPRAIPRRPSLRLRAARLRPARRQHGAAFACKKWLKSAKPIAFSETSRGFRLPICTEPCQVASVPLREDDHVILSAGKNRDFHHAVRPIQVATSPIAPKVRRTGVCAAKCVATSTPSPIMRNQPNRRYRIFTTTQKYPLH